ncbi:MAG: hypothetical protein OEL55_07560, partial [Desulfobulbaceae bacterium]|nr:hypothetical protein [Desulfobulbaceae bacterium]
KSGFSGIVVNGTKYNTGRETKFTPVDYRPLNGDTVTLSFYEKAMRGGNTLLAVSNLTLVKKDPNRKELVSPAKAVITEVGRSKIRFNFSSTNQIISMTMKRRMPKVPADWSPKVGDKVLVTFGKVKSRWSNNYTTIIEKLEKK